MPSGFAPSSASGTVTVRPSSGCPGANRYLVAQNSHVTLIPPSGSRMSRTVKLGLVGAAGAVEAGRRDRGQALHPGRAEDDPLGRDVSRHPLLLLGRRAEPRAKSVLVGDLASLAETRDVAGQANALGPLDAVIHNAGVYRGPEVMVVNVTAPYLLTTGATPSLLVTVRLAAPL